MRNMFEEPMINPSHRYVVELTCDQRALLIDALLVIVKDHPHRAASIVKNAAEMISILSILEEGGAVNSLLL